MTSGPKLGVALNVFTLIQSCFNCLIPAQSHRRGNACKPSDGTLSGGSTKVESNPGTAQRLPLVSRFGGLVIPDRASCRLFPFRTSVAHWKGSVSGSQLDLMAPMVSGSGRCPASFVDQFWAGFIHLQRPVIQTCAVHSRDRSPSLFGTGHLDEGKPTGLTRITILYAIVTLSTVPCASKSIRNCSSLASKSRFRMKMFATA